MSDKGIDGSDKCIDFGQITAEEVNSFISDDRAEINLQLERIEDPPVKVLILHSSFVCR